MADYHVQGTRVARVLFSKWYNDYIEALERDHLAYLDEMKQDNLITNISNLKTDITTAVDAIRSANQNLQLHTNYRYLELKNTLTKIDKDLNRHQSILTTMRLKKEETGDSLKSIKEMLLKLTDVVYEDINQINRLQYIVEHRLGWNIEPPEYIIGAI